MKQVLHKILSLFMTVVVLLTTMSFTVDMHYCKGNLIDFALFKSVKSCGMVAIQKNTPSKSLFISKPSCCSDKQLVIEGQENFKNPFDSLSIEQQAFITTLTYTYIGLFKETTCEEAPFIDYLPPSVQRNVQVLHQTFLI